MDDKEIVTMTSLEAVGRFDLSSCDFVGDLGCIDPDCWRCHSSLSPSHLRTLGRNLAAAAMLSEAVRLHVTGNA